MCPFLRGGTLNKEINDIRSGVAGATMHTKAGEATGSKGAGRGWAGGHPENPLWEQSHGEEGRGLLAEGI